MVQWLGLSTFLAEGLGSIPGGGTKIWQKKKKKKKSWATFVYFPLTASPIGCMLESPEKLKENPKSHSLAAPMT